MATASDTPLLTAEVFAARPDNGLMEELECGRIVTLSPPGSRHGEVCGQAYFLIRVFVQDHQLGRVLCNDSGVITTRNPDSVRGFDVAFYPNSRLHDGRVASSGYHPIPPELVVEVKSPGDRWGEIFRKVGEYLGCGVITVVVLDPKRETAQVYSQDDPVRILSSDEDLALGGSLEGFRVRVGQFFE